MKVVCMIDTVQTVQTELNSPRIKKHILISLKLRHVF